MKPILITFIALCCCCLQQSGTSAQTKMTHKDTTAPHLLTYLALGDSYTIGEMVAQDRAYPNQVAAMLNKKGTTWKQLDPALQNSIRSQEAAFKLIQDKTSVIKRPVVETEGGKIVLGFNEEQLSGLIHQ